MSNLVILKWQPFEYKAKFEKKEEVLKIYISIVTENVKPVPLCPIK